MTALLIATAVVVAMLVLVSGVYVLLTQSNHHKSPQVNRAPRHPSSGSRLPMQALRAMRWRPPRPTAPSGSSAGLEATALS